MKKKNLFIILSSVFLFLFLALTILLKFVDVEYLGEVPTPIGFSSLNGYIKDEIGLNEKLYKISDIAQYVALIPAFIFAFLGLIQWIKRKSLLKVDNNLFALAILYVLSLLAFLFFLIVVINYRPYLVNGKSTLESSYPSSTTILSLTFLLSYLYQIDYYVKNKVVNVILKTFSIFYSILLVILRVLSGVHWFTDIIGAILISISILFFYYALIFIFKEKLNNQTKKE